MAPDAPRRLTDPRSTEASRMTIPHPLLSPDEIAVARKALGLPNRHRRCCRNHRIGLDHPDWSALTARGLATCRRSNEPGGPHIWRLTRAAAEAALLPGETLDPQDFPD